MKVVYLEVDVQCLEKLHEIHNNLPFLLERMKIEEVEKLVPNWYDKTKYVIHIRYLKQALNYGLVLKIINILLNSSIESPKWTGLLISVSVFFISISYNFSVKNFLVW